MARLPPLTEREAEELGPQVVRFLERYRACSLEERERVIQYMLAALVRHGVAPLRMWEWIAQHDEAMVQRVELLLSPGVGKLPH